MTTLLIKRTEYRSIEVYVDDPHDLSEADLKYHFNRDESHPAYDGVYYELYDYHYEEGR